MLEFFFVFLLSVITCIPFYFVGVTRKEQTTSLEYYSIPKIWKIRDHPYRLKFYRVVAFTELNVILFRDTRRKYFKLLVNLTIINNIRQKNYIIYIIYIISS